MNLYLLRHGVAAELNARRLASDSDRPLTPEGKRKLRQIARAMQALELSFDLILSSPYLRARQSAEIVAEGFEARKRLHCSENLIPGGSAGALVASLNQLHPTPENILLVGHEPDLSQLVSLLVTGRKDASIVFKKGGLCKLTVESLKSGRCATLEWILTGKQLCLMA
jgi:phosphohistidine phosphatase